MKATSSFGIGVALGVLASVAHATEVRRIDDAASTQVFSGDRDIVEVLALSPSDPTLIAAGSDHDQVALVDLSTMSKAWQVTVGRNYHMPLVFSHDGRVIATTDFGNLTFLDVFTGAVIQSYEVTVMPWAPPTPYSIGSPDQYCFSKDDTLMIVGSNRQIVVADRATGQAVQPFWDIKDEIPIDGDYSVQFSPDERFVYLVTNADFYVLDIATGAKVRDTNLLSALGQPSGVVPDLVRVTSDGAYSVAIIGRFAYVIDNTNEVVVRRILAAASRINDVRFSDDQCCLTTASGDGTSRVYDIATGEQLTRLDDTRPSNERVSLSTVASPKRFDVVVTGDYAGMIRVWKPEPTPAR